jgi:hypothetical protein
MAPGAMQLRNKKNVFIFLGRTTQISHARRAGEPSLLNNWAMLSVGVIIDEGEIKGVAAVAAGSALVSYYPLVLRLRIFLPVVADLSKDDNDSVCAPGLVGEHDGDRSIRMPVESDNVHPMSCTDLPDDTANLHFGSA